METAEKVALEIVNKLGKWALKSSIFYIGVIPLHCNDNGCGV